ncbi:MAG: protein kinase [Thermoanaerobaculia bacterium]|nr:protein kinase [Thermoanaerobaculia bacterium]
MGPYEIVAPIGAGGMGEVYRAHDTRLGREIAIKVLPEQLGSDPDARARFEREARAIAAISHPNILAIHDFGNHEGTYFTVTELLEGVTLRGRLLQGKIDWRAAIDICADIADGLAHAHGRGIVHRDLKPENIFLMNDGRVKILDFGLAQASEATVSPEGDTSPLAITGPNRIIGTLGYMSPEQLRGEPVDEATDIFALGCILFELVTGRRAFWRDTAVDTISAILHEYPDDYHELSRVVPPDVETIVSHCLSKQREQRYQSARDLAMTFRAISSRSGEHIVPLTLAKTTKRKRATARIDSLAVLPFANVAGTPEAEYVCDGITETLINVLSTIPKLRVMASSTIFRYKNEQLDPVTIGRRHAVHTIVAGRVMWSGEELSVSVEIAGTSDGARVWGRQFEGRRENLLELQDQIATALEEQIRARVGGTRTKKTVKRKPTSDSEAYQLYIRGRFNWNKRTVEGIRRGIEYFEQAIERDPTFALAYVGIADAYITLATNIPLPPRETMPKAKAMAQKALQLDPDLAEAHASLASVLWWHEWNRVEAEKEFRQALRLNPSYAQARDSLGLMLAEMGQFDAAMEELARAHELDPLSLAIGTHFALPILFSGAVEAALEQLLQVLEIEPNFIPALGWLGITYEHLGMHAEAIETFTRILSINDVLIIRAAMSHALAVSGRRSDAEATLNDLLSLAGRRYVSPYDIAIAHAGLGNTKLVFDYLESAFTDRSAWMVFVAVDPRLEPYKDDPRFKELLQRCGLGPTA